MRFLYAAIQAVSLVVFQRYIICATADDGTDDGAASSSSSSSIVWDNYAILPRKCIYYNNRDVIIYSMFDNGNNMCSGQATGTFYTDVPTFVSAYMDQLQLDAQYAGSEYQEPTAATHLQCSLQKINGQKVRDVHW